MSIPFVFVHGWASNSTIWQGVIEHLKGAPCHTIDLGFIKGGMTSWEDLTKPAIYVGHSLGALWLLHQWQRRKERPNPEGFIAVSGFGNFMNFTEQRTIKLMQRGLLKNPEAQISHFWRQAGLKATPVPDTLNKEQLSEGLDWLQNWDVGSTKTKLNCPTFIIASQVDKIVPPAASEAEWQGHTITWHPAAPHMLPATNPAWLAETILKFKAQI